MNLLIYNCILGYSIGIITLFLILLIDARKDSDVYLEDLGQIIFTSLFWPLTGPMVLRVEIVYERRCIFRSYENIKRTKEVKWDR